MTMRHASLGTTHEMPGWGAQLNVKNKMKTTVKYKWAVSGAAVVIATGCLAMSWSAWADSPIDLNALQRQNDVILRQQQDQLRQDQNRAQRAAGPNGATLTPPAPTNAGQEGPCRDIKTIVVNGAKHLSKGALDKITRPYETRCLTAGDIEVLLTAITRAYFERGYVTTHAYLPAQDLTGGVLTITVVEGVIQGYKIEDDKHSRIWANAVFPASPGQMLDLRDLEQGIDQINRATSNNARLDIEPGAQPGQSLVVVHDPATFPLHLLTSYDNESVEATGRLSGMAALTEDGIFGLNEILSVNHRQTLPFDDSHDSKTDAVDLIFPFGYDTLTFDFSRMTYNDLVTLASGAALLSQGETVTRSVSFERLLFRNQSSKFSVSASLTDQSTSSYLAQQYLASGSRELDYLDLGSTLFLLTGSGMFNGQLDFVQGLPIFGALRDPGELPDSDPHAQFSKLTLDLSYRRPFALFGHNLDWTSHFNGQYGMTTLYGSEQMLIGGPTSVRGFLDNTLSGDSGFYWRNEIGLPFALAGGAVSGRVYAGFDVGAVSNRAPGVPEGGMTGLAAGVSLQWNQLSGEFFVTRALTLPAAVARESSMAFFRLSYAL